MYKIVLYLTLAWIAYPSEGSKKNEMGNTTLPDETKINDDEALPVAESRVEIEVKILTQLAKKVQSQLAKIDEKISHLDGYHGDDSNADHLSATWQPITPADLIGTWDTYFDDGDSAIYTITKGFVNVPYCNWNCPIDRSSIQMSSSPTYPSSEGWRRVNKIHRTDVWLLLRVKGRYLEVKYHTIGSSRVINGRGTRRDSMEYKLFYDRKMAWTDSEIECRRWGGHLATITSQALNDYLGSLLDKRGTFEAWIGLNDRATEGLFKWVGATSQDSYRHWRHIEPNGGNVENCVEIIAGGDWHRQWNDVWCGYEIPFICERAKGSKGDPCRINPCKNGGVCSTVNSTVYTCKCPGRYFGKNCEHRSMEYKVFDDRGDFTWTESENACKKWGGHLVTIYSQSVNDYIGSLLEQSSTWQAWIGLNDRASEGSFKWVGDTQQHGYRHWGVYEPNGDTWENCVEIATGAQWIRQWNDLKCNSKLPYICERPKDTGDPCAKHPCKNGGACSIVNTTVYTCKCSGGYFGKNCEHRDPCAKNPCKNGGECSAVNTTIYTCKCSGGYFGKNCEHHLTSILPGKTNETAAESCDWLNERFFNLRNGRYWIKVGNERKLTYCNMEGDKDIRFPNAVYGEDTNTTEYYIQGHVEVLHRNEWGTICDDVFDYNDNGAEVLCRMGGYKRGQYDHGRYKQRSATKSQRIWLDDVRCRGTESNIDECYHRTWGYHNCNHREDVGIRCYI